MPLFDLTGNTRRPVPGSGYLDTLKDFLSPDGEVLPADTGLAAAALQSGRAGENNDRLANDPTNPVLQARGRQLASDESLDPLSDASSGARMQANQSAADTIARFMDPAAQGMRKQQIVEHGQGAEADALGAGTGTAEAATSTVGQRAADLASGRKINEAFAGQGMAPPSQQPQMHMPAAPDGAQPQGGGSGNPFESPQAQQMLSQLDPATANIVKAIGEYRFAVPGGYALARSPQMRQYVQLVNQIDPHFDATQYEAAQKLRNDLTSQEGGLAGRIRSLNAASGHLLNLNDERERLGNVNIGAGVINPAMNGLANFFLGAGKTTAFDKTQGLLDTEVAKFLGGSGATNELRNTMRAGVNSNSSDEQIKNYIDSTANMMSPQEAAIRSQISAFPRLLPLYQSLLTPAAKKVLGIQ